MPVQSSNSSTFNGPDDLDLSAYAGHWVALVRGRVAGVGRTPEAARRAAQASRPKEKPQLHFAFAHDWQNLPLLRRLWGFIRRQGVQTLLVGGAVRDGLLGRPLHDLDFVVAGDATALAADVSRAFYGALVLLDKQRDTARVVVRHAGRRFDLDFARRQGPDWVTDLQARDFTVNAIAVDETGRYLDPLDGREDLAAGRLRAAAESAFRDDPLRTLRAVRLQAELNLVIAPQTETWIRRDAPLLPRVAAERVRDEFVRVLDAPGASGHLAILEDLGLLAQILPETTATQGLGQSPPHRWDVWTHTRLVVEALEGVLDWVADRREGWRLATLTPPGWAWGDMNKRLGPFKEDLAAHLGRGVSDERGRRFALKLAALFHDLGKPQTRSVGEEGRIHFYDHENVGAELAARRLRDLRFSSAEVNLVRTIVAQHLRPGHLARAKGPTRRAVYRYFKAAGDAGVEVVLLSLADMLATWGPTLPGQRWSRRLEVAARLLHAFFDRQEVVAPPPLVNGHELMEALELSPGPEVGRLLEAIREAQAAGEVKSKPAALALAARLHEP